MDLGYDAEWGTNLTSECVLLGHDAREIIKDAEVSH